MTFDARGRLQPAMWLAVIGLAALLGSGRLFGPVATAQGTSQPARRVVEAEEFRLVDANGKVRALLTTHPGEKAKPYYEDTPGLYIYDKQGQLRIRLAMNDDRPHFILTGRDNDAKISMYITKQSEGASLTVSSGYGASFQAGVPVEYAKPDQRECTLSIRDEDGKTVWKAP